MTDQSGRYGAQGDQPWFPGDQQQPPQQYEHQEYPQQYPQGYPQQGVPQPGASMGGQQQFVPQQPGMPQQGVPQGYPQQPGVSMGGQQQFVAQQPGMQQGYPQQGVPQPGASMGGQQQFVAQQPGMQQGFPPGQGHPQQGTPQQQFARPQGMNPQGMNPQGMAPQGMNPQGMNPHQGMNPQQGMPGQGMARPGMNPQGMNPQGMPGQGMPGQGMPGQGMAGPGTPPHGFPIGQVQQAMQQRPAPPDRHEEAPSGPGPDGIDWEAEAAALDNPSARRTAEPEPHPDEAEEWAEDEYQDEEGEDDSFFSEQDNSREAERKRKEKGKKSGRRNRGACLVVALVLLGGMGGAGWWGYGFYQKNFGPPPDFKGEGTSAVNVTIKEGSTGTQMGNALFQAGVVKSAAAFVAEFNKDPKGGSIQPGIYTMKHQMSAASAFKELVESNGGNVVIFAEGKRASDVYTKIDEKLKLAPGTTANVAKAQAGSLGLPAYANNNPEGFLWPARYSITDGMKPEDLLKQMVANAVQHYGDLKLDEAAQKLGLKNAYEVVTEASILQAEGNNSEDFGKMARAMSNRLNTNVTQHKLALDTTLQYELGRTKLTSQEINDGSHKYNSYINPGLPPTPIGNPGEEAIKAVLDPTPGDWVFWLAVSPQETKFAVTGAEHAENTKEWCVAKGMKFDAKSVTCTS